MKKHFLMGLLIVLPIAITFMATMFVVHLCTRPFLAFVIAFLEKNSIADGGWWIFTHDQVIHALATILAFVCVLLILFVVGYLAQRLVSKYVLRSFDMVFSRLPLIGVVYRSCRDFTDIIFSPQQGAFSQVVWCPFPGADHKVLGYVTNELMLQFSDGMNSKYVSVLLPGVPNPTVGFLVLYQQQELQFPKIDLETALKWSLSFGVAHADIVEHDSAFLES